MLASISSAAVLGVDAVDITIEVHVANGLPQWTLVGLAATAVKESRDRVSAALVNSGFAVPPRRITVSLSPGDLPKTGTAFDLPIALAVLAASGQVPPDRLQGVRAIGELGLDGSLRPVRGVLAVARRVAATRELLVVPPHNRAEATRVQSARVTAPASLAELVTALRRGPLIADASPTTFVATAVQPELDLADVVGQGLAVRALEIAAAGAHNVLLVGPPGAGKTMLARRLPGVMPPLAEAEALEVLGIHSVAGLLPGAVLANPPRPFRAPHHSVSAAGLIGGGSVPRPGEVSLAHLGVLFLDELSLFPRHVLESLRQPLEDGQVVISRASSTVRFPARFMLVAATNPCPCGYAGDPEHSCSCSAVDLERHRARLSGPLSDRIDLHVHVRRVPSASLGEARPGTSSLLLRPRITLARECQRGRYAHTNGATANTNAGVPARLLTATVTLDRDARALLVSAADRLRLSARAFHRVLRVARTIADLDADHAVQSAHVAEALRFRPSGGEASMKDG